MDKRGFLDGAKWQKVGIGTWEELEEFMEGGKCFRDILQMLTNVELERQINKTAIDIICYHNSEWGGDYFDAVERMSQCYKEVERRITPLQNTPD